jgi:hypothetical protein
MVIGSNETALDDGDQNAERRAQGANHHPAHGTATADISAPLVLRIRRLGIDQQGYARQSQGRHCRDRESPHHVTLLTTALRVFDAHH